MSPPPRELLARVAGESTVATAGVAALGLPPEARWLLFALAMMLLRALVELALEAIATKRAELRARRARLEPPAAPQKG